MERRHEVAQWFFAALLIIVLMLCLVISVLFNWKAMQSREEAHYFETATVIMKTNLDDDTCGMLAGSNGNTYPCEGMWTLTPTPTQ